MNPSRTHTEQSAPYWHVRKEDVHRDSVLVADPPWPAFDVVLRADFDAVEAQLEALRQERDEAREIAVDLEVQRDQARGRLAEIERRASPNVTARHLVAEATIDALEVAMFGDNDLRSRDELEERAEVLRAAEARVKAQDVVIEAAREVIAFRWIDGADERFDNLRAALVGLPEEEK